MKAKNFRNFFSLNFGDHFPSPLSSPPERGRGEAAEGEPRQRLGEGVKSLSGLMNKARFFIFIAMMLLGFSLTALAAGSSVPGECPVMRGEKAKSKFFVDYKGERHFFCCRSCVRKFQKNPEKYLGKK